MKRGGLFRYIEGLLLLLSNNIGNVPARPRPHQTMESDLSSWGFGFGGVAIWRSGVRSGARNAWA